MLYPNVGAKAHTKTYHTVKEHWINYIQKKFTYRKDIANSLENTSGQSPQVAAINSWLNLQLSSRNSFVALECKSCLKYY